MHHISMDEFRILNTQYGELNKVSEITLIVLIDNRILMVYRIRDTGYRNS